MNELVTLQGQLERYKKTIRDMAARSCKDIDDAEFEAYIHICLHLRLNPLQRQIHIWRDWDGKAVIHVGIDGFRAIANESGDYRPDPTGGKWETDDKLKGPTNPAGLVSATFAGEKFIHGEWTPLPHTARWEAYKGSLKPEGGLTVVQRPIRHAHEMRRGGLHPQRFLQTVRHL